MSLEHSPARQAGKATLGGKHAGRVLFSYQETADLLGVSYRTVWRMVQRGDLRSVTLRGTNIKRIPGTEIARVGSGEAA